MMALVHDKDTDGRGCESWVQGESPRAGGWEEPGELESAGSSAERTPFPAASL